MTSQMLPNPSIPFPVIEMLPVPIKNPADAHPVIPVFPMMHQLVRLDFSAGEPTIEYQRGQMNQKRKSTKQSLHPDTFNVYVGSQRVMTVNFMVASEKKDETHLHKSQKKLIYAGNRRVILFSAERKINTNHHLLIKGESKETSPKDLSTKFYRGWHRSRSEYLDTEFAHGHYAVLENDEKKLCEFGIQAIYLAGEYIDFFPRETKRIYLVTESYFQSRPHQRLSLFFQLNPWSPLLGMGANSPRLSVTRQSYTFSCKFSSRAERKMVTPRLPEEKEERTRFFKPETNMASSVYITQVLDLSHLTLSLESALAVSGTNRKRKNEDVQSPSPNKKTDSVRTPFVSSSAISIVASPNSAFSQVSSASLAVVEKKESAPNNLLDLLCTVASKAKPISPLMSLLSSGIPSLLSSPSTATKNSSLRPVL